MDREKLRQIKARAMAATGGGLAEEDDYGHIYVMRHDKSAGEANGDILATFHHNAPAPDRAWMNSPSTSGEEAMANAVFFRSAREDVLALVEEVEDREAERVGAAMVVQTMPLWERAKTLATQLGEATDALNHAIARAEQAMCLRWPGVDVEVVIDEEKEDEVVILRRVLRLAGKLYLETRKGNAVTKVPLTTASRAARILAVASLPDLASAATFATRAPEEP